MRVGYSAGGFLLGVLKGVDATAPQQQIPKGVVSENRSSFFHPPPHSSEEIALNRRRSEAPGKAIRAYEAGDYKKAEQILSDLHDEAPGCFESFKWLGVVLEKEGRFDEALAAYEKAIAQIIKKSREKQTPWKWKRGGFEKVFSKAARAGNDLPRMDGELAEAQFLKARVLLANHPTPEKFEEAAALLRQLVATCKKLRWTSPHYLTTLETSSELLKEAEALAAKHSIEI